MFALTWAGGGEPLIGIDASWQLGLGVALEQGITHGDELVFTYGPLGFLKSGLLAYPWPARLAGLYGIATHLALSLSLVWAARRSFPLPAAVVLALIAAVLIRGAAEGVLFRSDATVPVLAFVWCVAALRDDSPSWAPKLVAFAGGPVAAIEVLGKLNTGVVVLALLALTVVAIDTDRRRNLMAFTGSFLASVAVLWLAAGQAVGDAPEYLERGLEIVSGYSVAMGQESAGRAGDYALAAVAVALAGALAWLSTRTLPARRRIVIGALLAILVLAAYKAGFVRHGVFQVSAFFATVVGACLAFRLPSDLTPFLRHCALLAIAAVAIVAGAITRTTEPTTYPMTDPIANLDGGISRLATLIDPGRLDDEIAADRAQLAARYDIDQRTLELVREGSVHVDPWEAGIVWAYGLEWRPLPVFQTYSAYTEGLDELNADALASDDGPERILRPISYPADERYPGFESPAAMVAMLCNFKAVRTTPRWQVLARIPDRCGEPRELETVDVPSGGPIRVPRGRPDELVVARVNGVDVSGAERLLTLLHRARRREIVIDGRNYKLVPGTAADGLLLRAPRDVDFPPRPFRLAPDAREISFLVGGEPASDVEVEFLSVPVLPAGRP